MSAGNTGHPQKRSQREAESQSYSAAGGDGGEKINILAPRKYTSGKSGFIFLMCVRIYLDTLIILIYISHIRAYFTSDPK